MQRQVGRLSGVVLVAVMFLPGSSLAQGNQVDPLRLADAIRFRSELGFDASPDRVAAMITAGVSTDLGLPLSVDESAEWVRRGQLRERMQPALDFADSRPESFGGVFFDQTVGNLLLVVQLAPTMDAATQNHFEDLLPPDSVVEYRSADFSTQQLRDLMRDLASLAPDTVTFIAADPVANRVQVAATDVGVRRVLDVAGGRSDALSFVANIVVPSACTSRLACYLPWRGGTRVVVDGGGGCTWGFNGRPTTSSTTKYIISAGHCSRLNINISHNGSVVTVSPGVDRDTYDMLGSQTSDSLSAPLKTDSGARNLIYLTDSSMAYAITSIKTGYSQQVGDSVCMSGSVSSPGYRCGVIELEGIQLTYSRQIDGKLQTFTAMTRASMNHTAGDSGAPIIAGTLPQAWGILNARNVDNTKTYYSPIDYVLSDLVLRLCLDSACN